jgi:2-dehydropantoate 2-reductase
VKYIVYGAGAIGGVIGARLFQHGHDVMLIARGRHYEVLRAGGLRLRCPDDDVTLPIPTVDHPNRLEFRDDDVVVLAMKTQDTAGALAALSETAPPGIAIVCAQNGVENERLALRRFEHVYGMCVMCPAMHLEPGVVEANSSPITGLLDLGRYPTGIDPVGESIAKTLETSTFESIARPDITRWKYAKLLMNLGNAAEALCGHVAGVEEVVRRARREGARVLHAAGVDVASRDEDRERRGDRLQHRPVRGSTRGGGSSWQSLERGTGRIESDYLNGEIVLVGRLHGVATPVNALLQRLANAAARRGDKPGAISPTEILEQLPD